MARYEITTITGNIESAGTDANVWIVLYGTRGETAPLSLDNAQKDDFERAKIDTFAVDSPVHVGDLTQIKIYHDNSGEAPGWYLEQVIVVGDWDTFGRTGLGFTINKWLATDEQDLNHNTCAIVRLDMPPIPCVAPPTMFPPNPTQPMAGQWFFFRMQGDFSVTPCFTMAIRAPDEATGKRVAELQNGGYTATPIDYASYIRGC